MARASGMSRCRSTCPRNFKFSTRGSEPLTPIDWQLSAKSTALNTWQVTVGLITSCCATGNVRPNNAPELTKTKHTNWRSGLRLGAWVVRLSPRLFLTETYFNRDLIFNITHHIVLYLGVTINKRFFVKIKCPLRHRFFSTWWKINTGMENPIYYIGNKILKEK